MRQCLTSIAAGQWGPVPEAIGTVRTLDLHVFEHVEGTSRITSFDRRWTFLGEKSMQCLLPAQVPADMLPSDGTVFYWRSW